MDDAKVQKPWIEALFCGTNVMRLLSYLRLKIKIDFIRRGIPSWMHREYFLNCGRQQLCYEILERLQVGVRTRKSDFRENRVSSLNKILEASIWMSIILRILTHFMPLVCFLPPVVSICFQKLLKGTKAVMWVKRC